MTNQTKLKLRRRSKEDNETVKGKPQGEERLAVGAFDTRGLRTRTQEDPPPVSSRREGRAERSAQDLNKRTSPWPGNMRAHGWSVGNEKEPQRDNAPARTTAEIKPAVGGLVGREQLQLRSSAGGASAGAVKTM